MPVATPTILSAGKVLDPRYEILSIEVHKEVNRISDARLVLVDGNVSDRTFALSDSTFFEPGSKLEIKLRYEGEKDVTVFQGLAVRHGVESSAGSSRLTVELKDAAIKLTQARKSAVFADQTDDQVIARLIRDAGLAAGTITATQPKHATLVQYYATDWDFIVSRADIQGLAVVVEAGSLSLLEIALAGSAKHAFQYGLTEIYDLEFDIDATTQYNTIESLAWDVKKQALTQPSAAKDTKLGQGNLDGKKLASTLGFPAYTLSHPVVTDAKELTAWANARLARSRLSLIRGRLLVPGFAGVALLDTLELTGVGKRFDGKALITGITHRVNQDGWQTELQLGLSPEWFCQRENIADCPAAGLLPPVTGLQIGIVDEFVADPDKELRVKVLLPAIAAKTGTVWARLASPDAGKNRGFLFWPEKGDEVVVGFLASDPRQPVILGSLYSSANPPPKAAGEPSKDNPTKAIVTKKGTIIGFVNKDKAKVFIETAGKNTIVLDDDAQSIVLTDSHGNSIRMDKNGIELSSAKDVKIAAKGNLAIQGQAVDIK